MSIKITNTRQAIKIQASQRSKVTLGKKVLELGKEYALLFPKKDNEIVVSGIVGRNCDYDALGVSFGRISDSQMEVNEDTGRIKDNSGMQRWAVLSNILYKAAMAKDIQEKIDIATKLADSTGSKIDQSMLEQSIAKVKLSYEGQPRQGEDKAIMPIKQRLISTKVDFSIFTEAVLVPLDKKLKPEFDRATCVEVRLSSTKQKQLNEILDNPVYNNMNEPDGFLEVKFSYKGTDTKEAGKNPYLGCETSVIKVNLAMDEDGTYSDSGTKSIAHLLSDTTHDNEIMYSRAGTVSFAQTSEDVEAAMRKYLANNRLLPLFINMEDESTKKNAKLIIESELFSKDSRQFKELTSMIEVEEVDDTDTEDSTMHGGIKDLLEAKTTKQIETVIGSNQELADMVSEKELSDL